MKQLTLLACLLFSSVTMANVSTYSVEAPMEKHSDSKDLSAVTVNHSYDFCEVYEYSPSTLLTPLVLDLHGTPVYNGKVVAVVGSFCSPWLPKNEKPPNC